MRKRSAVIFACLCLVLAGLVTVAWQSSLPNRLADWLAPVRIAGTDVSIAVDGPTLQLCFRRPLDLNRLSHAQLDELVSTYRENKFYGFELSYGQLRDPWSYAFRYDRALTLGIPNLLAVVLCLIFPFQLFRSIKRMTARSRRGMCIACGYDLRASAERCPECGAVLSDQGRIFMPRAGT